MSNEIIYTKDYVVIVSNESPKNNEFFVFTYYGDVYLAKATNKHNNWGQKQVQSVETLKYIYNAEFCKTIIAHKPLSDAPILDGVPLINETYGGNK